MHQQCVFYLRDFFFTHFVFKDGFQETTTRPSRMNKYRNWWQLLSSERIVKYNWTNILIRTLSLPSHLSFVLAFLTMWMSMAMIQIILNQSFHCWKPPKTYCLFSFCGNFSRWQQLVFEDIVWTCKLICQDWLKAEGYLKLGVMHNSNIFVPTKISTLNNKEKYEVYLKSSCMLNQNIFSLCMASFTIKLDAFLPCCKLTTG